MLCKVIGIGFMCCILGVTAASAENCRIVEYPDRIEVICNGTPALNPAPHAPATAPARHEKGAEVSRIRRNLMTIRNQNAHRLDDYIDKSSDAVRPVARQNTLQTPRTAP